jgi:hypothetical protein
MKINKVSKIFIKRSILLLPLFFITSCGSYEQFKQITEEFEIPSKIYRAERTQAWQAVLQIMRKYDLETQSQESGIIKTRWIDNTISLNFADSFGGNNSVKAAKFKVIVNVVKGFRGSREVTKVTVYKRQLVEQDLLQGWKEIPSDGIFERTLLYRLGRIMAIDNKLKKIEEEKAKEAEAELGF